MEAKEYYVVAAAVSSMSLFVSLMSIGMSGIVFLIFISDRRIQLKITPCVVKLSPQSIVPLNVPTQGLQGVDFVYGFVIENGNRRYSVCITGAWEDIKVNGVMSSRELRGHIIPTTFPYNISAGGAAVVVMDRSWGKQVNEKIYIVVKGIRGKVWKRSVPAQMSLTDLT